MRKRVLIEPRNPAEIILAKTLLVPDYNKIRNMALLRSIKKWTGQPWSYLGHVLHMDRQDIDYIVRCETIPLLNLRYIAEALEIGVNELIDLGGFYTLLEK